MFRSSFSSCISKNTDVIEKPDNENQNHKQNHSHHQQLIELFSPNFRSNICRPRCSESSFHEECIVNKNNNNNMLTRISRKADTTSSFLSERKSLLPPPSDNILLEGQKCPPASPASPYDHSKPKPKPKPKPKRNTTNKKKKKKSTKRRVSKHQFSGDFHAFPTNFNYNGLFSSGTDTEEEDDDKTTLFSSTTDSSSSFRRGRKTIAAAGVDKNNRRAAALIYDVDDDDGDDVKVKDSFAVVKRSRDPYSDFRTSMEEMIIEKQIFSGEDLENLLRCFLSLNSYHHHKVIIRVFTDIWEALFL